LGEGELPDIIFYGGKDLKIVKTMFRKFRMFMVSEFTSPTAR
jgi:hypothetical protein